MAAPTAAPFTAATVVALSACLSRRVHVALTPRSRHAHAAMSPRGTQAASSQWSCSRHSHGPALGALLSPPSVPPRASPRRRSRAALAPPRASPRRRLAPLSRTATRCAHHGRTCHSRARHGRARHALATLAEGVSAGKFDLSKAEVSTQRYASDMLAELGFTNARSARPLRSRPTPPWTKPQTLSRSKTRASTELRQLPNNVIKATSAKGDHRLVQCT